MELPCRICGCTEERACPDGCAWVKGDRIDDKPICTTCDDFKTWLEDYVNACHKVDEGSLVRLLHEIWASRRNQG